MSITEKKEFLLHIVEDADEKLTGLLIALANEYNTSGEKYSDEEIEEFYKIRDNLLADPETGYTPEQVHEIIRNKSKNAV
ncbi:MAG: hypothetical protein ABIN97_01165 [Ginsengibacter sp.]